MSEKPIFETLAKCEKRVTVLLLVLHLCGTCIVASYLCTVQYEGMILVFWDNCTKIIRLDPMPRSHVFTKYFQHLLELG